MKQLIITVGKKHDPLIFAAIENYTDRLMREVPTMWQLIKPSGADEVTARRLESKAVVEALSPSDFVVLLDERGELLTSEAFAIQYENWLSHAERVVFVIGGAYGVDEALRKRSDIIWSLSKLVFPHQLVRLILAEQLYRARLITKNHPYHHT